LHSSADLTLASCANHTALVRLTCFALSLDYVRIVPTVNVATPASRKKMEEWMTRWKQEKKRRADAKMARLVPPRATTYW
jgi:DNA cross-link repair 1A protein